MFIVRRSARLSNEAEKKSLADLSGVADLAISSSGTADHEFNVFDAMLEVAERAFRIAARRLPVYRVTMQEGHGDVVFYFCGDFEEVLRKVRRLQDAWT